MKQETKYYCEVKGIKGDNPLFLAQEKDNITFNIAWLEEYELPESIEELKLEWQQHNRDNGLSWNEVAELVNQVAMLKPEITESEIQQYITECEKAYGRPTSLAIEIGICWVLDNLNKQNETE